MKALGAAGFGAVIGTSLAGAVLGHCAIKSRDHHIDPGAAVATGLIGLFIGAGLSRRPSEIQTGVSIAQVEVGSWIGRGFGLGAAAVGGAALLAG